MRVEKTRIEGVWVIYFDKTKDNRGFFTRSFCQKEFAALDLPTKFVQENISFNQHKGTLRGMHFQKEPHVEGKLIYCLHGRVYDVILDIRPHSSTYKQWQAFELSLELGCGLYIFPGLAHGFQTLEDHTLMYYHMTEFYYPDLSLGIRWNDPAFKISWPLENKILSDKDISYSDWKL